MTDFDYIAFAKAVAAAVAAGHARAIAAEFEVTPLTVEGWARRAYAPHPLAAQCVAEFSAALIRGTP